MKKNQRLIMVLSLCLLLVAFGVCVAAAPDKIVKAKIGIEIKSGDLIKNAKAQNDITVNDLIRVYVHSKEPCYLYIIHTDLKEAELLKSVQLNSDGPIVMLPSPKEFYRVDGVSPKESFSVIVSPTPLPDVMNIFKKESASVDKWAAVENSLLAKSKITLGQEIDKPIAIAGNTRAYRAGAESFGNNLLTYSGKSVLIKKYDFKLKKQ